MTPEMIVTSLLLLFAAYLLLGFIFAIFLVVPHLEEIDEGTHGSSWRFKLIITPGLIVFWPVFLKKIRALKKH